MSGGERARESLVRPLVEHSTGSVRVSHHSPWPCSRDWGSEKRIVPFDGWTASLLV